jgi:poly-gamma-glutamate synthesis protein (capsule biosynthesis protein)
MNDTIDLALTGDLVLDEPDAGHWLAGIAPRLRAADLALGHLEVAHTRSRCELAGDIPAPGAPPENLAALADAGFGMVSLAGNHIADCGPQGIADTLAGLDEHGVLHAGAGMNLIEARRPAIATCKGRAVALLSYNCVGPEASWAANDRAGCSFLPIGTDDGSPATPRANLIHVLPDARGILAEDIAAARRDADFVIVALHKGIVHTPAKLAPYERPVAHAAIELGADAVISHHAHIVRGIEFHRGSPIFHGLGNGCVVTRALSSDQNHAGRAEWARKRREMFGFEPDPAYVLAPFHPEAINGFIGRLVLGPDGTVTAGLTPVHVEAPGRPVVVGEPRAREIADYVEAITLKAGLPPIRVDDSYRIAVAA